MISHASSIGSPLIWTCFIAVIVLLLSLDLGILHRRPRDISLRESIIWVSFWMGLALLFNVGVYFWAGPDKALEFLTGYIIEQSLSVDNIFVFLVIFSFFKVPPHYQHRVLFYGILGAIVMRGIFILVGAELIARFHAIMYLFGAILIYSGVKLALHRDDNVDPSKNIMVRLVQRIFPVLPDYRNGYFFVREQGKLFATPLLLVLVAVEVTDLIFAVDSVPAIFAISRDPFIVFTSNIFAILGLRSIYFLLAGAMTHLIYLRYGLCVVLVFVGVKMLLMDIIHIPTVLSLMIIACAIGAAATASLWVTHRRNTSSTKPTSTAGK